MRTYIAIAFATFAIVFLGLLLLWRDPIAPTSYQTPTLAQLNTSIKEAEVYYEGLYKPVGNQEAVVSEYYSLPLNAQIGGKTILLGQDTKISNYKYSYNKESATLQYNTQQPVKVDYVATWYKDHVQIGLHDTTDNTVSILLGEKPIATLDKKNPTKTVSVSLGNVLSPSAHTDFQSNRYTVRHATQTGISYYKATYQPVQENALLKYTESFGLPFGYDLHSVIWGDSAGWPTNFVYNTNVYYDCYIQFPTYQFAYAYKSKVCSLPDGPNIYVALSKTDSLVPTQAAIQNVERGQIGQAVEEDQSLEQEFDKAGFGLSTCPKISILPPWWCSYNEESTIRTATFGVLELKLGHTQYADKVASLLVQHQVQNGDVSLPTGQIFRPLQTGAIPLAWNRQGQFVSGESTVYKIVGWFLNMHPEYLGPIPTNAETQADGLAFLLQYRCQKYNVCN